MHYHLVQLGCQMNQADTERIAAVLQAMGYRSCEREEEADILGVVACSVRQKAIDKVYSKIAKWNDWKISRNLLTFVSGCILPSDREKFLERFDLLFSINELPELPSMIGQYGVPTPVSLASGAQASNGGHSNPPLYGTKDPDPKETAILRPVGPVWLKDRSRRGISFVSDQDHTDDDMPAADRNADDLIAGIVPQAKADRHKAEQEARRRSTLQAISLMREELRKEGGADAVSHRVRVDAGDPDPMGGFWHINPSYSSSFEAFVPIQNGCDKFCTFCAVPYTRGREVSRPSADIYAEVRRLVQAGYSSITLLGQNVNSYGLDRPGSEPGFAELLRGIGEIGKASKRMCWVYFTSPHPRDMTDEVLETIAAYDCLAKQIHLPIQSGDDKVLLRMNRNYGMSRYRSVAQSVKRILPTATLFTDIIVGFTGETDGQFARTKAAMEEFRYNMAFIAMYSPRPGAASSRWEDDVPLDVKKARLQELSEILHTTSLEWNRGLLGKEIPVLADSFDATTGFVSGRTEGKMQIRFRDPGHGPSLPGAFVQVKVDSVRSLSMEGSFVQVLQPASNAAVSGVAEPARA